MDRSYFLKYDIRYLYKIEKRYFYKLGPILFCLIFIPPLMNDTYITHLMISGLMFGAFGVAFDLGVGYCGIVNFGFAGFVGLGAYFSALSAMRLGISPWFGLLIAGVVSAGLGLFAGVITLRLRGIYLSVLTFFLAETLKFTVANLVEITRGYMCLGGIPAYPGMALGAFEIDFAAHNRLPAYYLMLTLFFVVYGVSYLIIRSRIGVAWRAVKQDEVEASVIGVDTTGFKVLNFIITCFFAGLLGSFYAHYIGILTPDVLGMVITMEVLTYVYIGGRGTLWGGVLSAFIFVFLMEILRPLMVWRFVIYGVLLTITMIFFPKGLSVIKKYIW